MLVEHEYSAGNWQDFTGGIVTASVNLREFEGRHSALLTFYNADMDPAQSSSSRVIKKGDRVRIHANNNAGTRRKMATMLVTKVNTAIDLKKPPGRRYLVTVQLHGQGVAGVAGVGSASGVDNITDLSNTITGAAYEIGGDGFGSGRTTPSGSYVEVAYSEVASEADQILTTRDSNPGTVVFEDPDARIQIFDSAVHRTGAPSLTIDSADYSDIDMTFDMSHIVNVLTVKYLEKIKGTANKPTRVVEHDHVYVDSSSKAKYGPFKKTHVVHKKSDFAAYAAGVFARNADPAKVPRSVTIPIRRMVELLPGYQDGFYVGNKVNIVSPNGATTYVCRVSRITHSITNKRWLVQVFLRHPDVVKHRRRPHGTNAANNPDGAVLGAHIDDDAVDSRVIAPGAVTSVELATAVNTAISTAQTTANAKNAVHYSTLSPTGTPADGDTWFKFSGGVIVGQWKGVAGAWSAVTLDSAVIANLDAGKITTGTLSGVVLIGNTVETATSGRRIVMTNDPTDGATLQFWTGVASEVRGYIYPYTVGGKPAIWFSPPSTPTYNEVAALYLSSDTAGNSVAYLQASQTRTTGDLRVLTGHALLSDVVKDNGSGYVQFNCPDTKLRIAGGTNIAGKLSTDFATATGSAVILKDQQVIISTQGGNPTAAGPGNTVDLYALAIRSQGGGLWMDDLNGGGSTGCTVGNGGRLQRTTSSIRYKYAVRPLALEEAGNVVRATAAAAATFKRKKLDRRDPADPRRYGGLIAEDLALEADAEPFLIRDREGRPDGVHYAELVAPLASVVVDLERRLAEAEARIDAYVNLGSPT
jgi:hypothetical protein